MGGVAYTTGLDLDDAHKEIHVSLSYIKNCCGEDNDARRRDEIIGVITHEMVHCYQYNGLGTAPGGLIEGIADFVRLKAGLSPPHWSRKEKSEKWDQGYQHTAYFLEWIEEKFGEGSVARINLALKGVKYKERRFWRRLFGSSIKELWGEFDALRDERMKEEDLAKEGAEKVDGGEKESKSSPTDAGATDAPKGNQAEDFLRRELEEDGKKASDEEEMVVVEKEDESGDE
jgi:Peptidase of plants and bacteria